MTGPTTQTTTNTTTPTVTTTADVVVVGAGNAGLCAAAAAIDAGASVVVLEKAPRAERGGNTRFTVCYAFPYDGVDDLARLCPAIDQGGLRERMVVPPYTAEDFRADLDAQSGGRADPALVATMVAEALPTMEWLTAKGLTWDVSLEGAWHIGKRLHFQRLQVIRPTSGGASILDTLFGFIEGAGAPVLYDTAATGLVVDDHGELAGVRITGPGGAGEIAAGSVVLAAGGFEASPERRARYLGRQWDLVKVRGSRYNTGEVLDMALGLGAATAGHWSGCHATQVHASSADVEVGDSGFPHAYPFSIMVNLDGERFVDEAADFQPATYATLGQAVLEQPDGVAFQVFDAQTADHRRLALIGDVYDVPHAEASDLHDLAMQAGLRDPGRFTDTVERYNAAIEPGEFNPSRLDGKTTVGLDPPKSNWALPIDTPPFEAYRVTCGITFTYGGLALNPAAEVLDTRGRSIPGLYVAGEMAGTFYHNYVGCSGLTKGAVLGRIAGTGAARRALGRRRGGPGG